MKYFIKIGFCSVFSFLLTTFNGFGESKGEKYAMTDTISQVTLLFPFDSSVIESGFMDNKHNLARLHSILTDDIAKSGLDSITIIASSSPEGIPSYNRKLAERRANSMKSYITQNYQYLNSTIIGAYAYKKYWDGLIMMVEQDPHVPGKEKLLEMLDDTHLTDAQKSYRMSTMQAGVTFAYLRDKLIFQHLRVGSATIKFHYQSSIMHINTSPETHSHQAPELKPEIIVIHQVAPEPGSVIPLDTTKEPNPPPPPYHVTEENESLPLTEVHEITTRYKTVYPFALKTNLLLDVVGGPNLGLEIPLGDHLSIAGDFAYAYSRLNNRFALQTIQGSIEGRYWFRQGRNPLTGWSVGVYGTYCSRFDIQWNSGYQGDGFWSAGLSAGYSLPISKSFNIGFSVMGGFLYSPEVRRYSKPRDGHLMWEETRYDVSRLTLTQVRVDLVWLLKKNKPVSK